MLTTTPFGETVVLHTRTPRVDAEGKPVTDEYGNDVFDDADTALSNVPLWPRNSSELVQGQDTSIVGLQALLPAGTSVWAIDSVTVQTGAYAGRNYEVDGEPGYYKSPFTGRDPGVLVNLTRITG